ncbi:hypothetical protein EYZ11_012199 [Aspergillus tanneri]|uniref:Uncharacterized protein n=1 Tax=Aspergillus tanneri TaxID=1220188 RepID=A0A4S3J0V7_9EURO|nr:hypothetical protein EYZ11_012199 [Aspergillus tanneri]
MVARTYEFCVKIFYDSDTDNNDSTKFSFRDELEPLQKPDLNDTSFLYQVEGLEVMVPSSRLLDVYNFLKTELANIEAKPKEDASNRTNYSECT